jgi:hypothetical protein
MYPAVETGHALSLHDPSHKKAAAGRISFPSKKKSPAKTKKNSGKSPVLRFQKKTVFAIFGPLFQNPKSFRG